MGGWNLLFALLSCYVMRVECPLLPSFYRELLSLSLSLLTWTSKQRPHF